MNTRKGICAVLKSLDVEKNSDETWLNRSKSKSKRHIGSHLSPWLTWGIMGAFAAIGHAHAAVTCSSSTVVPPDTFIGQGVEEPNALTTGCLNVGTGGLTRGVYDAGPGLALGPINRRLLLWVPATTTVSAAADPIKIAGNDTAGLLTNITSVTCSGGTIAGVGTTEATLRLPDTSSCALTVTWGAAPDVMTFTTTVVRTGVSYSFSDDLVYNGGPFGAATPASNPQNIPVFGPLGLLAMLSGLLWFGNHSRKQL